MTPLSEKPTTLSTSFNPPLQSKKKKVKKLKRLKPKKAMTPFMVFSKETRKFLVAENPNMTFSDIGKELGARWRSLSEKDREIYVEKSKDDYQRFLKESERLDALNPNKKRKSVEQKQQTKKKKAISAYLYFCNAHREQVKACHPDMKMVEIQRLLANKWKNSSKTLKLPYEKQAEADREKYNSEIRKSELKAQEQLSSPSSFLCTAESGRQYSFPSQNLMFNLVALKKEGGMSHAASHNLFQ